MESLQCDAASENIPVSPDHVVSALAAASNPVTSTVNATSVTTAPKKPAVPVGMSSQPVVTVNALPSSAGEDAIITRFNLNAVLRIHSSHLKVVRNLIQNGLYYLTVNNSVAALAAFSSAASYVYALQNINSSNASNLQHTMSAILGYVETLQEKTKGMGAAAKSSGGDGDGDKDEESIEMQCEAFGCERDAKDLCLTFKDVVGMMKEKQVFFDAITNPLIYPNLYTKSAKGILLYGPPGTGKTYLVKAAIRELATRYDNVKVLFFPLTGADLKGKYVGETEKKIVRAYECASRRACQMTDLYNQMGPKKCKPNTDDRLKNMKTKGLLTDAEAQKVGDAEAKDKKRLLKKQYKQNGQFVSVLFIDEFDSVGGDRAKDESGMVANAVNTFLQMMDGTESKDNVITVCATNFPWNLDAALLRRFSEQVYCNVPNFEDIKRLITKEQEERFKLKTSSMIDYCGGGKMKKIFDASKQIQELIKAEAKPKGACETSANERSILDLFDRSYMKDSSHELMAIVSEMAEKYYSNSDVANVMMKAFNKAAESALRSSVWYTMSYPPTSPDNDYDRKYCVSKLTKILDSVSTDEKKSIDAALEALQKSAINVNTDELTIPKGLYIDKESVKSIFPAGASTARENQATCITIKNKQYTNIRFIKSLPTVLMFNDNNIADIFYNVEEVEKLNSNYNLYKTGSFTSKQLKDVSISVVFSRVMKVDYDMPVYNDNIDVVKAYHEMVLGKIENWDLNETDAKAYSEILASTSVILYKFYHSAFFSGHTYPDGLDSNIAEPMQDMSEIRKEYYVYYENGFKNTEPSTPVKDTSGKVIKVALPPIRNESSMLYKIATALNTVRTTLNKQTKLRFFFGYVFEKFGKLWGFEHSEEKPFKYTASSSPSIYYYDFDAYFEMQKYINVISPDVQLKLVRDIELISSSTSTKDQRRNVEEAKSREYLQSFIDSMNEYYNNYKPSADATTPASNLTTEAYKVFYFHSKIRPFDGTWVHCKAGGVVSRFVKAFKNGLYEFYENKLKPLFKFSDDSNRQAIIETIAARMESTGTSALKYLLLRANGIGVCDGGDDRIAYNERKGSGTVDGAHDDGINPDEDDDDDDSPRADGMASTEGQLLDGIDVDDDDDGTPKGLTPQAQPATPRTPASSQFKSARGPTESPQPVKGLVTPSGESNKQAGTPGSVSAQGSPAQVPNVSPRTGRSPGVSTGNPTNPKLPISKGQVSPAGETTQKDPKKAGGTRGGRMQIVSRNKTQRARRNINDYVMYGGENAPTSIIHWFDLTGAGPTASGKSNKIKFNDLLLQKEFIQNLATFDSTGRRTSWSEFFVNNGIVGLVGAGLGVAAVALFSPLAVLAGGLTLTTGIGVGMVAGTLGAATAIGINSVTSSYGYDLADAILNVVQNDILGSFSSFDNPEDDVYIVNLMLASMFTQESYKIKRKSTNYSAFVWNEEFANTFYSNYAIALDSRQRYFSQHAVFPILTPYTDKKSDNVLTLKHVVYQNYKVPTNNYLNFYMDASFIGAALKAYPSTYNPISGKMLNEYNKNRVKFLEDYQAGKYDKKKS